MIAQSERCEQCGGKFESGARKRIGKRAWCSKTCVISAGLEPKPEPKVFRKAETKPRPKGTEKKVRYREEGYLGAI